MIVSVDDRERDVIWKLLKKRIPVDEWESDKVRHLRHYFMHRNKSFELSDTDNKFIITLLLLNDSLLYMSERERDDLVQRMRGFINCIDISAMSIDYRRRNEL